MIASWTLRQCVFLPPALVSYNYVFHNGTKANILQTYEEASDGRCSPKVLVSS